MSMHSESVTLGGRTIEIEVGEVARQADGAVVVRCGRALVLVTVVGAESPRPGMDFFPLTVEYREKLSAAGRIPGGIQKREGRIKDDEILVSRIIDRSLRPLFPKGYRCEVQVQATVFSADPNEVDAPMLALLGAGAALELSPIPWSGPVAGVRVVRAGGNLSVNPSPALRRGAEVDLVVSAGPSGLVMVEGSAEEAGEGRVLDALGAAEKALTPWFEAVARLREACGKPKRSFVRPQLEAERAEAFRARVEKAVAPALTIADKAERRRALDEARGALLEDVESEERGLHQQVLEAEVSRCVREMVLAEGRRLDGRKPEEIRPIACRVGYLPAAHGSSLFTRGQTQALVSCTLAAPRHAQRLETLSGEEHRRFLLHYNFPPYSVGETRPLRGPGRREIGHGNLALRALEGVLPPLDAFPYTIRVESEITESNGSSSMATVCGGSLALMDAGVPLSAPVAGIAMGLVSDGRRHAVLSDILGDEDHLGDMDFKVAGTARGICALQMDNKLGSLSLELLKSALQQAKRGREHILEEMGKALAESRPELADHAPRSTKLQIPEDAVGSVIGPRGSNLKALQSELDVDVTIGDHGELSIFSNDAAAASRAISRIQQLAGTVEAGKLYQGEVSGVKEFGAFVRIFDTAEGLVHISEWDHERVEAMNTVARVGDRVVVRVLGADEKGRIKLSRKQALDARGERIENE